MYATDAVLSYSIDSLGNITNVTRGFSFMRRTSPGTANNTHSIIGYKPNNTQMSANDYLTSVGKSSIDSLPCSEKISTPGDAYN